MNTAAYHQTAQHSTPSLSKYISFTQKLPSQCLQKCLHKLLASRPLSISFPTKKETMFSFLFFLLSMISSIPCFLARFIPEFPPNSSTVLPFNGFNKHLHQLETFIDIEHIGGEPTVTGTNVHSTKHFEYFPDQPRWSRPTPMMLTYAFSPDNMTQILSLNDIRVVFQHAFVRWASTIPVSFYEIEIYDQADIKIGFYSGDHGDGQSFDGVLGTLAHAFSPESGELHLDASETWAVDFGSEKSKTAVDLESVALHEIGHVLGLAHSFVKEAVMYPSLSPRTKKVELKLDDVHGIQALYGSNPNFSYSSILESDIVTSNANQAQLGLKPNNRDSNKLLISLILFIMFLCL